MIRFCDKDVCCVQEDALAADTKMIVHFLVGHKEERLCIIDEKGCFVGTIIYQDFLDQVVKITDGNIEGVSSYEEFARILGSSINRDYVIFDETIWEEGRKYFKRFQQEAKLAPMLPVLNEERQLLCFAWQDDGANKEIRMLDELMEFNDTADFRDIYPECMGVTIHGCNELTYHLLLYLKKTGIPVELTDKLWGEYSGWRELSDREEVPDYGRYTVYGEGLDSCGGMGIQRESVSAEFECIDRIYEANICQGIIGDTKISFQGLLDKLRGKKTGILGTGYQSLKTYDLLVGNGVDICCFVAEGGDMNGRKLFGKRIVDRKEALQNGLVLIDAENKYSAWGGGETDLYHYYYGLRRNQDYILLQDYTDIPDNGLQNVCGHYIMAQPEGRLILTGELHLCQTLWRTLVSENRELRCRIVYCDVLGLYGNMEIDMMQIDREEMKKKDVCLLLLSGLFPCDKAEIYEYTQAFRLKYLEKLRDLDVEDVVEYPTDNVIFKMDAGLSEDCEKQSLRVKKIVIGANNSFSGNIFFRGLLDGHPDILMVDYCGLGSNLFAICARLAGERGLDILQLLWKILEDGFWTDTEKPWEDSRKEAFGKAMEEMLSVKESFTSQELFVMLHIAWSKMWGKEITDISNMTIYWEPHCVPREECESYAIWLDKAAVSGCIVNVVRNACIRAGSMLSDLEKKGTLRAGAFLSVWGYPNLKKKEYEGWKRITVKFEDIKRNPQKELRELCMQLDLTWSDTLLETTSHGEREFYGKVTGFDLAPVYRTHEEFFSEFDRFRLSLILGPWQRRYGYPYVRCLDFSRRELQAMFSKRFRFEERIYYMSDAEKTASAIWMKNLINQRLWEIRREEIMDIKDNMEI